MTKINLLPWREELREFRKQQFYMMLGISIVAALVAMVGMHIFVEGKIENQISRNMRLKQEIALLDKKIVEIKKLKQVKSALMARMAVIERLQSDRPLVVRLFHEMVDVLPPGVHLTRVLRMGNSIIFSGFAESNTNISNLMRKIDSSTWLRRASLREIKNKRDKNFYAFSLRFQLYNPDIKDMLQ